MQGILSLIRYFQREFMKKLTLSFFRTASHRYVTRISFVFHSYVIHLSSVCHSYAIRLSLICRLYLLGCNPYVTRMYSYVILMSLVCTRMLSVCTRMYSYVTRLWFYHEPCQIPQSAQKYFYRRVQYIFFLISRYFKLTKYIRI